MKKIKLIISLLVAIVLMPGIVKAESNHYNLNANQNTYQNTNVTVGNVAGNNVTGPVYAVDIEWSGLSFDWVYNSTTGQYEWADKIETCESFQAPNNTVIGTTATYYRNNTCTNAVTGSVLTSGTYYYKRFESKSHSLTIADYSENGIVKPRLLWIPTTNYNYTTASFYYETRDNCEPLPKDVFDSFAEDGIMVYKDAQCSGTQYNSSNLTYGTELYYGTYRPGLKQFNANSIVPTEARLCYAGYDEYGVCPFEQYDFYFELGVDRSKTVNTPVKGDKIGSLTVMLTPQAN